MPLRQLIGKLQAKFHARAFPALSLLLGAALALYISLFLPQIGAWIDDLELKTYDLRANLSSRNNPDKLPSKDIAIIAFDDTTLSTFEDTYGAWPWPRNVFADMTHYLHQAGAKAIVFDMVFVGRDKGNEAADRQLVDAFKQYPNVYTGLTFDNNWHGCNHLRKAITQQDTEKINFLNLPVVACKTSKAAAPTAALKDGFFDNDAIIFNGFRGRIIPELFEAQDRLGFINEVPDKDGVYRGTPLVLRLNFQEPASSPYLPFTQNPQTGQWYDSHGTLINEKGILLDAQNTPMEKNATRYYPNLGLKLWMDLNKVDLGYHYLGLTPDGHLEFPGHTLPLDKNGNFLMTWYNVNIDTLEAETALQQLEAQRNTLQQHPLKDPLAQQAALEKLNTAMHEQKEILRAPFTPKPYKEIGAWEVLNAMNNEKAGQATPEDLALKKLFHQKTIFIGTTASSISANKPTPISKLVPDVLLEATLYDNLNQGNSFITRTSAFSNGILCLLLCLLGSLFIFKMRSAAYSVLTTVSLGILYILLSILAFKYLNLWVNLAMPLTCLMLTIVSASMIKYVRRDSDYQKTYKIATTDGMTGLYNYRYFQQYLSEKISQATLSQEKFSLVMIDVDHFKKLNDQYGHQIGDEVLRYVAQRLRNTVRNIDFVARYGGEEMAILLEKTDEAAALQIAQKLVQAISEHPFKISEEILYSITISAGAATYPTHGRNNKELIGFADQALYRAKAKGRNQVGNQYEDPPAKMKRVL